MKDFVTYKIAQKLKEKGYPQKTSGKYSMVGACYFNDGRLYEDGCIANVEDCYSAPQIHEVLKWMREEKKIHISIMLFMFSKGWCYEIVQIVENPKLITTQRNSYDTYERAALVGIEYVIDNLI